MRNSKLVAEVKQITERHARRLLADGDPEAHQIIENFPDTPEGEFRLHLEKVVSAVASVTEPHEQVISSYETMREWFLANEESWVKKQTDLYDDFVKLFMATKNWHEATRDLYTAFVRLHQKVRSGHQFRK